MIESAHNLGVVWASAGFWGTQKLSSQTAHDYTHPKESHTSITNRSKLTSRS